MIEIRRWDTDAVIYTSKDAASLAHTLIEAVRAGVDLYRASLDGASLVGASLVGARLDRASLYGARLDGASLVGARLDGARLVRASLYRASLDGASLVGASLVGARLDRASLDRASLDPIRDDVWHLISAAPHEVTGLLAAIRSGRFDGTHYEGDCVCLVGTIAKVRGCSYNAIPTLTPDDSRPAERWALAIREGDTPDTNPIAAITAKWIEEWLGAHPEADAQP